jgi:hypothetical protein
MAVEEEAVENSKSVFLSSFKSVTPGWRMEDGEIPMPVWSQGEGERQAWTASGVDRRLRSRSCTIFVEVSRIIDHSLR